MTNGRYRPSVHLDRRTPRAEDIQLRALEEKIAELERACWNRLMQQADKTLARLSADERAAAR